MALSVVLAFACSHTHLDMVSKITAEDMQIYIEQVEDLLNLGGGVVKLREDSQDPWGPVVVEGLVRHPLSSLEQAMELVRLADGNRAVASTQMNMASSRSHVIFTLFVERSSIVPPDAAPGEVTRLLREAARGPTRTKLHVLDLAGSERLKKTGASGVAVEEARAREDDSAKAHSA